MPENHSLTLPETVTVNVRSQDEPVELPLGHGGEIVVPGQWLGKDWEAWHQASRPADKDAHPWQRQFRWAKERVVEWHIEGLPTNPNQIEDARLAMPLMRWLTTAVYGAMEDYLVEEGDRFKPLLSIPSAWQMSSEEYFAAEAVMRKQDGDHDDKRSSLLKSWEVCRLLVRDWGPAGKAQDPSGMKVDLGLIGAVNELGSQALNIAVNLGNLRGPRGAS